MEGHEEVIKESLQGSHVTWQPVGSPHCRSRDENDRWWHSDHNTRHSLCFLLVNDDVCGIRGEGGVPTPRMLAVRMTDRLSRKSGGGDARGSLFNSTSGGQQHGLALPSNAFEQDSPNVFASRKRDVAFTCGYEESTRSPTAHSACCSRSWTLTREHRNTVCHCLVNHVIYSTVTDAF